VKPARRHVCMISHSAYEADYRVMRYAEALAARGDAVDVFAVRRNPVLPSEDVIRGVQVFRIQDRLEKSSRSKLGLLWPLLRFLFKATRKVAGRHMQRRYDIIHVHNIPDFLVLATLYPRLTGAKVILDIHDLVPELFANNFRVSPKSVWVRALKLMERLSARCADHIIIANHLWFERYVSRSAYEEKCSVLINYVDNSVFQPKPRMRNDRPLIIFPGGLQWHQGLDIGIRALAKLRARIPDAEFHIYGDGPMKESLIALTGELGLRDNVRFFDPLPLDAIAGVMAHADLGIVPKRADSFGNEAYSTKIMEFMSVGVPVIVSETAIDRHYFDDSAVRFFPSGDSDALADAMYDVLSNEQLQSEMVLRGFEYAARNRWSDRKSAYEELINSLHGQTAGETALAPPA
jgi:glycosyltransferase involved in cell wall biosynthesis